MAKKILLTDSGGRSNRGALLAGKSLRPKGLRPEELTAEDLRPKGLTGRLLVKIDPRAELGSVLKGLKGVLLERLRVAVIEEESAAEVRKMAAVKGSVFVAVEQERVVRKLAAANDDGPGGASGRPGRGGSRSGGDSGKRGGSRAGGGGLPFVDNRVASWGIQAVNVLHSGYTGKGVKLAVLDTGFDFGHPDFAGRTIHRKSFVGRQAFDKDGHGTHCAGIAGGGYAMAKAGKGRAGAASPSGKAGVRYGVAPGVRLYIGKILDDNGEGSDGVALAAIEWALEKGCKVISMSFGAEPEESYSAIFESVAQTVLAQGSLLIGATGNESKRGRVAPVNHPANCPSVLAVGALTAGMKVAEFSCGGVAFGRGVVGDGGIRGGQGAGGGAGGGGVRGGLAGGQVDLVAPGDQILSARLGGGTVLDSGTSMAAPFVAGVAALLWERYPEASAWEIWARLGQGARRLGLPASAVGAGLVWAD
ncbi:MAG TPA: S8 family serine peptidase [Puia sp.]|uniref:S8 family peptidase n=1 Tax=Puia sp. TaxID=2045100 RepID=UPI002BC762D3|nr:S8 family serine peptidase [Puia sp.]HVU95405.1 S8 family serine peptidase [Puia sp.]